jgi:hypothetical protein
VSTSSRTKSSRPREVTISALLTIVASAVMILAAVTLAEQLDSSTMRDTLTRIITDPRFASLDLSLDEARSLVKYTLMAMGGLSVTSLVLGAFVLRRHQPSRIALTALGAVVAVLSLFAGLPGWVLAVYVGVSVGLLWTRSARAWFNPATRQQRPGFGGASAPE